MALALQSLVGVALFPLAAYLMCESRREMPLGLAVKWTGIGIAVIYAIAVVMTQLPWAGPLFDALGHVVAGLQRAVDAGSQFMFGYLAGAKAPFTEDDPTKSFVLAFRILPMILVLSALVRLFYHWGLLQLVVQGFARVLRSSLGIGGPLATGSAAAVFLGTVETPLVVKPYLKSIGRGALFAMMAATMATVAGSVMALYAVVLAPVLPGAAGHLLAASLMNVPAALVLARLAVPEGFSDGGEVAKIDIEDAPRSSVDAVARGAMDGIPLVAAVATLLIVSVAMVALINQLLAFAGAPLGIAVTLEQLLGWASAPLAWSMGIPMAEATTAGAILGKKIVLNELIAYLDLAKLTAAELSARSRLILTYALCGFANVASLGIVIGGLSVLAPERRSDIVSLAPKSVVIGAMATMMSGAVIGSLTWS